MQEIFFEGTVRREIPRDSAQGDRMNGFHAPMGGSGHADRAAPRGATARGPWARDDEKSAPDRGTIQPRRHMGIPENPPRLWRRNSPR